MTKRTYSFLVLLLWCCDGPTTTITTRTFVGAFLPLSTSKKSIVDSHRQSSSCVLFGGALGNDDFSNIFGKQEAAERRTRDLAREYHPPPKQPTIKPINTDGDKDESSSSKNSKQQQESRVIEDSPDTAAMAINTTKVVQKYVRQQGTRIRPQT